MPIRIRLAALFAAGTALLIGVGGAIFVNELSGGLTNTLATGLETRAAFLSTVSGHGLTAAFERTSAPNGAAEFAQLLSPTAAVTDSAGPSSKRPMVSPTQIARLGTSRHGLLLERSIAGSDADILIYLVPLSGRQGALLVGASLSTVDEALDGVEASLLIGGPIGVLLAAVASYLLAGAALRPVDRMRRQAAAVSEHETAILDVPRTDDELAALARTLNALLTRLHGALGRQRGFVASAGHELRTPLANLKLELELASHPGRSTDELLGAICAAGEEVDRLAALAERLLILAQSDETTQLVMPTRQDVVPVLGASVESFRAAASACRVALRLDAAAPIEANVDAGALRQVFENVLDNALRFAPPGSTIDVSTRVEEGAVKGAEVVVIDFLDEGPGFAAEFVPRAFERFSRPDHGRDRRGGGAGLGLAIVKSLVQAHGGEVEVANRAHGGAHVRIRLPMARRAVELDLAGI